MLTKRQNMMEVIRGGNPDRFVKQYEGLTFVLNTPYQVEYPMMPEAYRVIGISALNPNFLAPAVKMLYQHVIEKYKIIEEA